jgi:hypothetical protein
LRRFSFFAWVTHTGILMGRTHQKIEATTIPAMGPPLLIFRHAGLLSLVKIAGRPGFTLRGWRVGDGRRLPLLCADGGCEAKGDRHDDGRCFQGAFLRLVQDPAEAEGFRQPTRVVRMKPLPLSSNMTPGTTPA